MKFSSRNFVSYAKKQGIIISIKSYRCDVPQMGGGSGTWSMKYKNKLISLAYTVVYNCETYFTNTVLERIPKHLHDVLVDFCDLCSGEGREYFSNISNGDIEGGGERMIAKDDIRNMLMGKLYYGNGDNYTPAMDMIANHPLIEELLERQQEVIDLNLQIKYTKELILSKINLSKNNLMIKVETERYDWLIKEIKNVFDLFENKI